MRIKRKKSQDKFNEGSAFPACDAGGNKLIGDLFSLQIFTLQKGRDLFGLFFWTNS